MPEALWITLPFVVALGSGVLSFIVAQARMQALLARDREKLVEARTQLAHQLKADADKVRAAVAEARRKALDEFLADVHVEEQHYVGEVESPFERRRRLVVAERICFRNIPLTRWLEREIAADALAAPAPEPTPISLAAPSRSRRLLR